MKRAFAIAVLIAVCLSLLSLGVVNVSADGGPIPQGMPAKQVDAQAIVIGVPHGVSLSKEASQTPFTVNGEPQQGFSKGKQPNNVLPLSGSVTVTSVWTTDGNGNGKTSFNPGDAIKWYGYVYNTTGSSKTAYFVWSLNGPCGSQTLWSGNLSTAAGQPWWNLSGTVPNCPGTYTYSLSVTYNGSTSSRSTTYTVNGGNVTVASVWTTDGSGNGKTSFNPGDAIHWVGNVSNTTSSTQTAYFVWSLNGPCGSQTLWSGNLTTGSGTWTLNGSVPSNACGGTYTYNLSITYNGSNSSKSTTYTVSGGGNVTVTSVWVADGNGNINSNGNFITGNSIYWYGNVSNTTGSAKTAYFVWSLSGPCGSQTLYSGNLSTSSGTVSWYLPGTASTCSLGSDTFTLSVGYNGSTTSKSVAYTVKVCQCVDYIRHRFNLTGALGNAKDMGTSLLAQGFHQLTTPQIGAVVVMKPTFPGADPTNGHVAVILTVSNGSTNQYWVIRTRGANQDLGTRFADYTCTNVSDEGWGQYLKTATNIAYYSR